jgi:hypothetical protein
MACPIIIIPLMARIINGRPLRAPNGTGGRVGGSEGQPPDEDKVRLQYENG